MVTIVVEDGTGVVDANAYVDSTFVDDIAEIEQNTYWLDTAQASKDLAIVQATRMIETLYGSRMYGEIVDDDQSLLYPREAYQDSNGRVISEGTIPKGLKNAVAIAALYFNENLLSVIESDAADANVRRESFSVGSGAYQESVEYFENSSQTSVQRLRVEAELSPFVKLSNRQFSVYRG